jgi:hypothetical protein
MSKTLPIVGILLVSGIAGLAQDTSQYQMWMRSVGPLVGAIRKAPDSPAAKNDAATLAGIFTQVESFWFSRQADDAVKLSETALQAARGIASGTGDNAANLQRIQDTCGACHMAHRVGSAPNFKIK